MDITRHMGGQEDKQKDKETDRFTDQPIDSQKKITDLQINDVKKKFDCNQPGRQCDM